jgi:hypothetical protein
VSIAAETGEVAGKASRLKIRLQPGLAAPQMRITAAETGGSTICRRLPTVANLPHKIVAAFPGISAKQ